MPQSLVPSVEVRKRYFGADDWQVIAPMAQILRTERPLLDAPDEV